MTLAAAIMSLLLLPCGWPVEHARRYEGGPDRKADVLSEHVDQAAQTYDLDPFLLVALGHSESGLDGTRVGKLGEVSLMQFLPHSAAGREYARARGSQAERDGLAVLLGAEILRRGLEICGSESGAVSHYKAGRCGLAEHWRVRDVLALRDRLKWGRQ